MYFISISNSSLSLSPFTANDDDHDHGDPFRLICWDDSIPSNLVDTVGKFFTHMNG